MAVILSPSAKQQFFLNDGSPAAGGKLYTYAANTTTPQATYTNRAGTVPNANPIILDARGEATIYLTPGLVYDYVLRLADDTLVWTREDVVADLGDANSVNYYELDGTAIPMQDAIRERLRAGRTYYVRTDGNDNNSGLSNTSGGAFLTIQRALTEVSRNLDTNGKQVTIRLGDGTYTAGGDANGKQLGSGLILIQGNLANPAACQVIVDNDDCFKVEDGAWIYVQGVKMSTTTGGSCLKAYTTARINYKTVEFGACASSHVECGTGAVITAEGTYTISGGAVSHWHCGSFGLINMGAEFTITLTGTPNFSSYFAGVAQGTIVCGPATFSGSATGTRFLAHKNGTIDTTQGETSLPGSLQGRTATGGVYRGNQPIAWKLQPDNGQAYGIEIHSMHFNDQVYETRFKTLNGLFGGFGWFYCNGDDGYSSGRTHFAGDANVLVASGTTDGWSFATKGSGSCFQSSSNNAAVGYMRRRSSNGDVLGFFRDTSSVGGISVTTTNTQFNTSSDARIKDWLGQNYDPTWIGRVGSLVGDFRFNHVEGETEVHTGWRAQELVAEEPSAVNPGDDNPDLRPGDEGFQNWGVDYSKLVPKLLLEVAELRKRLDALETP